MSRAERKAASFADMARTLFVFLVIILVSLAFVPRNHHDKVKAVDYVNDLSVFAHASTFKPFIPTPVPAGWKVTSFAGVARRDGSACTMHMGIVTQQTHYADLEEADAASPGFTAPFIPKRSVQSDDWVINGLHWDVYTGSKDGPGIVYRAPKGDSRQMVISGGATLDELRALASSLRVDAA